MPKAFLRDKSKCKDTQAMILCYFRMTNGFEPSPNKGETRGDLQKPLLEK
jgi:hypothetical protein